MYKKTLSKFLILFTLFFVFFACATASDKRCKSIDYFKAKGGYVFRDGKSLDISGIDNIENKDLECLLSFPQLEVLSLNERITDEGLKYVENLKNLRALHLDNTRITNEGLRYIQNLDKLRVLYLSDTKITDNGLKYLENLTNLEILWLNNTGITNEGLKSLQKLPSLGVLLLGGTSIDDNGIKYLETMKTLAEISLISTKVTPAGVNRLKKKLQACRIITQ